QPRSTLQRTKRRNCRKWQESTALVPRARREETWACLDVARWCRSLTRWCSKEKWASSP
ncbi:hypothetical protein F443_10871, partial [Phytophthora nicotianae P1569]